MENINEIESTIHGFFDELANVGDEVLPTLFTSKDVKECELILSEALQGPVRKLDEFASLLSNSEYPEKHMEMFHRACREAIERLDSK